MNAPTWIFDLFLWGAIGAIAGYMLAEAWKGWWR